MKLIKIKQIKKQNTKLNQIVEYNQPKNKKGKYRKNFWESELDDPECPLNFI